MGTLMDLMEDLGLTIDDFDAPLFVAWQITGKCNLHCMHCCEDAGHALPDEMNHEEIFNFLVDIVDAQVPYVALSGGEPLLHPLLFEICEYLRKHEIALKIETNGVYIDESVAKRFANIGFRSVQVSLDGATADTYERMRSGGNWERAVNACKYLIREGINTEVVFVPTKFNIHETGKVIDLAASLGASGFYTGKIMRIGRAALNWDIVNPDPTQYEKFFSTLREKEKEYENRMKLYYYPYDVIEELRYRIEYPAASILVLPNGKVKLIGTLPFVCADVKIHSLKETWERYKKAWRDPKVVEYATSVCKDSSLLRESKNLILMY